jgi:5-methylcytosine-specific restriction endonuclease McrA
MQRLDQRMVRSPQRQRKPRGPKPTSRCTSMGVSVVPKTACRAMVKRKTKAKIHCAVREQVWLNYTGQKFSTKCATRWCQNRIDVFNFQCGHKQAEAKGGATTVENLIPLCARCNLSMGTMHFDAWNTLGSTTKPGLFRRFLSLFRPAH